MLQWFTKQKRKIQSYPGPWVSPQKTLLEKLWRKYEDAEAESQLNTEAEAKAEAEAESAERKAFLRS